MKNSVAGLFVVIGIAFIMGGAYVMPPEVRRTLIAFGLSILGILSFYSAIAIAVKGSGHEEKTDSGRIGFDNRGAGSNGGKNGLDRGSGVPEDSDSD